MEPIDATENVCPMETVEDNVGLSDIIDYINSLGNQSLEFNGVPLEAQATNLPSTSTSPAQQPQSQLYTLQNVPSKSTPNPFIRIVEQPAGKALRFRYECEGRSAGSIPGVNSTPEHKTFPAIEIVGYKGEVTIVVSCVTKDPPYRPHPHNLVGKDGCKNGICTIKLSGESMRMVFSNLGIQCVKKRDIKAALDLRERFQVDPFRTKFGHKDQPTSIDLNAVRLCFQAFWKPANKFKSMTPVVSEPIYDKKAMSDLVICRLCSCSAKVSGGDEIILLCEKISKDDIKVKFYEKSQDDKVIWEEFAQFQQTDIHKQTAIAFKTPRYHNTDVLEKTKVFLQLVRPSDGVTSESLPFEYYPDADQIKRKRLKTGGSPMTILRRELQKQEQLPNAHFRNDFQEISPSSTNTWNITCNMPDIKTEPEPAMSPQHFGAYRSPHHLSPSPQPNSPMHRTNSTPSPCLMKALSAGSQAQMCDMFNYNIEMNSPLGAAPSQLPAQQYHHGNPCMVNSEISEQTYTTGGVPGIEYTNISIDNNAFKINNHNVVTNSISGGSMTPLWPTDTTLNAQNMLVHQPYPLHNEIDDMLTNTTTGTEEGSTLSGLLACLGSDQLLPINSDTELPVSNLTIRT